MPEFLLPIDQLAVGAWAEVIDVTGPADWAARVAELGLRSSTPIRMIRSGCPCVIQVGGARLSLRCEDQGQILVRPLVLAAPAAPLSEVA